jgi:formamidopyrimidine-DNA glycosylase
MPEGIEIRKFADVLRNNILGHKITHINILKGRYSKKPFEGFSVLKKELPLTVESINTKGKFTYFTLSNNDKKQFYLFNTLGLSGGWTVKAKNKSDFAKCENCHYMKKEGDDGNNIYMYPTILEYISEDNSNNWFQRALNHLNVEFITNIDKTIVFYDILNFGTLKATDNPADLEKKLKELGPDMMEDTTTFEIFKKQITKGVNKTKPIGNVIVNQKLISGVGNYLRADGLWMSKISPFRNVEDISDKDMELLYKCLRALMWGDYNYKEGVKKGVIEINKTDKTNIIKLPNDYKRDFFVYRQDKDINEKVVKKTELFDGSQKRFIHWVEEVQK